jgi:hypothetical protein
MKRSHRVALTAITTTAVLAGAGSALAFSSLQAAGSPAPVAGAVQAEQLVPVAAADAQALHEAVGRLEQQVGSLTTDLADAQRQLEAAQAAAQTAATAAPAPTVRRTTATRAAVPAPRRTTKAPAVHTRTGASGGGESHDSSEGGDD